MSILGLGTDIVAVARIRSLYLRHGDRFLQRCFRDPELSELRALGDARLPATLAGRWAAKEAFLKALGGPIGHIPYHQITVLKQPGGAPCLRVTGAAAAALGSGGPRRLHLTISHEHEYAVATVVIENRRSATAP